MQFGEVLQPITLNGPGVTVRPFEHRDAAAVEEASRDDFIPTITTVPAHGTPGEIAAFIDRQNGRMSSGEGWSLAIADGATDAAVGQIGLWISQLRKGRVELGYWMVESARGRGAAAEALELLCAWAFEHLDIDRASLYIEPWNVASMRTGERAGFFRETQLRSWERVAGHPKDMVVFTRLRPDTARPASSSPEPALRQLEDAMWTVETRNDPAWMDDHLTTDFVEFGRSGRRYERAEILEPIDDFVLDEPLIDFAVTELSSGIRLVTYQSLLRGERSNRASIWRLDHGRWRMAFHQGTPTEQ